jgi:hypothetical protein
MSTNPIPPVPPFGAGNPDLTDPDLEKPDVGTVPDNEGPLSQPVTDPEADDEDPNDQLPRD